jgi:hypothetical protein
MTTHAIPTELAEILEEIIPPGGGPAGARGGHRDTPSGPGGAFRHRQHIHLAFIAVRRYGTTQAVDKTSAWIRHHSARAAASASLAPGYRRIDTMCPLAFHWRTCAAVWSGPLLPP